MRILSLGWGVQSLTIAAMIALGELDPIDFAIHADTGWESHETKKFIRRWTPWLERRNIKIITVGCEKAEIIENGFVRIPSHKKGGGMGRRQCTRNWKLTPIRQKIREEVRKKGLAITPGIIEQLIGISIDEEHRARENRQKYIKNRYPLIEMGMTRNDCKEWLKEKRLGLPGKSSCIICPYHNNEIWLQVKRNKKDWSTALKIDKMIQDENQSYLHYSGRPLEEIIK